MAAAQSLNSPQPRFRHFSVAQGLPSSETYNVHQDRKGYIWICTDRGVARYDGYRFKIFTKKDGLTDNVVFKIYEDDKGRLWFITYNGLLCYWDGNAIRPYKYNNLIRKYLGNDVTTYKSFSIDRHDRIMYCAQYLGLITISPDGKMTHLNYGSTLKTRSTYLVRFHRDWLVSPNSKGPTVPTSEAQTPLFQVIGDQEKVIGHYLVSNFAYTVSSGKRHFVQLNDRIIDIDHPHLKEQNPALIAVSCDDRDIWMCTTNGVQRSPMREFGKPGRHSTHYLSGHTVTGVLKDSEGGYWFSTLENGIFYVSDMNLRIYRSAGLRSQIILDVTGDGPDVYFASQSSYQQLNQPFWSYSSASHFTRKIYFLNHTLFLSLSDKREGTIGSLKITKGLKGFAVSIFNNAFVEPEGTLLTVRAGVERYASDGKHEQLYLYFSDTNATRQHYIHAVAKDGAGRIYVGSVNGLFEMHDHRLWNDRLTDPRFRVRISDLDYHPLWKTVAATRGTGIYWFDDNRIIRHLTDREGLLDNQVNSLFIDRSGIIWVATNKGVNKISLMANGKLCIERLTAHHGLPSNEITGIYAYGNQVWVATRKGLVVMPADLRRNRHSGNDQLHIQHIETDREHFLQTKRFTIAPGREYVRIVLRSSNFRTGENRLVRYRYDTYGAWLTANSGELLLPKPAAGEYVLETSYQDEDGIWSVPYIQSRFTIEAPFYTTWYFYLGLVLLGMGLVFLLFRLRLRQLSRRHDLQKTINQLEQKALRAQMNPHFIFNSLNSIQSFLVYEENEKAERYLLKFAQLIRQTLNNSRESNITIEAEMETLRRYLELEQMRFKDKFGFTITCNLSDSELLHGIPPMLIQPFVENAVLHGFQSVESGGTIEVVFASLENSRLLCIVEDNGVGRKATEKRQPENHKSFGTKITAERLAAFRQKYGDDFTIETIDKEIDGKPAGTKVILRIPVVLPQEIIALDDNG